MINIHELYSIIHPITDLSHLNHSLIVLDLNMLDGVDCKILQSLKNLQFLRIRNVDDVSRYSFLDKLKELHLRIDHSQD